MQTLRMSEKEHITSRGSLPPYDHQLLINEDDSREKCCCNTLCRKRYLIAFLAMLVIAAVDGMRVVPSVALVAMVTKHTVHKDGQWIEVC